MSRDNRQIQNKKPPISDGSVLKGRLGVSIVSSSCRSRR